MVERLVSLTLQLRQPLPCIVNLSYPRLSVLPEVKNHVTTLQIILSMMFRSFYTVNYIEIKYIEPLKYQQVCSGCKMDIKYPINWLIRMT